jgi:predicted TIM-barrel fold metal-dependent hydrolase
VPAVTGKRSPRAFTAPRDAQRQCWISADPDESSLPAMVELVGADRFFWASDFPHPHHVGNYIEEVEELGARLKPGDREKVLGANVLHVYGCSSA